MAAREVFRNARWGWSLPGLTVILLCLLPSGSIIWTPDETRVLPIWMAPLAWPLVAMGLILICAAFSERTRRNALRIVIAGSLASMLLELALSVFPGNIAIYSFWLGKDLGGMAQVDFRLDVLAYFFVPLDLMLLFSSLAALWLGQLPPVKRKIATSAPILPHQEVSQEPQTQVVQDGGPETAPAGAETPAQK